MLKAFRRREPHEMRRICLLGRVVPIKDIKTFIRAIKYLSAEREDFEAWIVGPQDENEDYAQECFNLVSGLGVGDIIHFRGIMPLHDVLPEVEMFGYCSDVIMTHALPKNTFQK